MTGQYNHAVLEGYPDGTIWTHYYSTEAEALRARDRMREANPNREYEVA